MHTITKTEKTDNHIFHLDCSKVFLELTDSLIIQQKSLKQLLLFNK